MALQSGITPDESLRGKFGQVKDGHVRVLVIAIENESLIVQAERDVEETFDEDFEKIIPSLVESNQPAYYFVRLDTVSEISGHNWLFILYVPDNCKVRQRMLYTSTVATLKREFGLASITQEIRTSTPDEMTLDFLEKHRRSEAAPPPLTAREEEKKEIEKAEMNTSTSVKTRQQTLQGLRFPFDEKVTEALDSFKQKSLDYLQLEINDEQELIQLSHSEENITPENIQNFLPANAGRYHIYRFKHDFNDEPIESIIFLYSVPGHGVKISQRMVYASCKGSVIDAIEKQCETNFERKLELSDITDLTTAYLIAEIHPEKPAASTAAKPSFTKPKAPTRGPRRLVKTTDNPDE